MPWPESLAPDTTTWRPERVDIARAGQQLVVSGRLFEVHDTFAEQVAELDGPPDDPEGTWFLYPWSGRLVHLLSADDFRRLRTDRNRDKITREEQERLTRATIGIVGLSVGQSAALTLALEGVGGTLRLADFDALSLSNLNRLRAGVHELGLPKAILAARAIAELDPYIQVEILPEGVREDNLDTFLDGLDLLVEECDDLAMKLRLREAARARRLPVVMDTSDRGLFDIERFDREPDRPLLHGLVGDLRAADLRGLGRAEKIPYVLQILGEETVSDRLAASLPEVGHSLRTWPQLASAVALGGAIVTDTARRILLDQGCASGRYHVDLEELVGSPSRREGGVASQVQPALFAVGTRGASPWLAAPLDHREGGPRPRLPSVATVCALVGAATLAPTGHNAQPWRFEWSDGVLSCALDPARCLPALDFDDVGAWAGLGAAAFNLELAAGAAGLRVEHLEGAAAWSVRFVADTPNADPLAPWIERRVTNRRVGTPAALGGAADLLRTAAAREGGRLRLVEPGGALDAVAAAIGEVDRVAWLLEPLHRAITEGLRWTPADVAAHRDGLDVDGLDLSPAARAGLRVISRWSRAARLAERGLGRALVGDSVTLARSSSAIGLLAAPSALVGGRAMQRVWLEAARLCLGLHPVATLPSLLARRAAGRMADLGSFPGIEADLDRAEGLFRSVFPVEPGAEILLFRLLHAAPPRVRSVRRPVEAVLRIR